MDNYTGLQNIYSGRMFCEKGRGKQRDNTFSKGEPGRGNDLDYEIINGIFSHQWSHEWGMEDIGI